MNFGKSSEAVHRLVYCVHLNYYIYTINTKTLIQCNHKIAVIIVFFGKWPKWIHYFLSNCNKRSELQFIIFSDNQLPKRFNNIFWYHFTLEDFSNLARDKIGLNTSIIAAYKVCDFKPAYGKIFEDYLTNFEFWAHSDIDLFYGELFPAEVCPLLQTYDVLSFYKDFVSGPFCIYRNRSDINLLFMQIRNYSLAFENPDYIGFDEHIIRNKNRGITIRKILLLLQFIPRWILNSAPIAKTWQQFKYEFQWFVKRKTIREPVDMSEAIMLSGDQKKIKVKFQNLILNDSEFFRCNEHNWQVNLINGKIIDMNGNEHAIFHFIDSKKDENFKVDEFSVETVNYKIDSGGIRAI